MAHYVLWHQVYGVPISGTLVQQAWTTDGSGSTYLWGYLDSVYRCSCTPELWDVLLQPYCNCYGFLVVYYVGLYYAAPLVLLLLLLQPCMSSCSRPCL